MSGRVAEHTFVLSRGDTRSSTLPKSMSFVSWRVNSIIGARVTTHHHQPHPVGGDLGLCNVPRQRLNDDGKVVCGVVVIGLLEKLWIRLLSLRDNVREAQGSPLLVIL